MDKTPANDKQRTRNLLLDGAMLRAVADKERTIEVAFASEVPVERWYGYEILTCTAESIDLSRLNSGGAVLVEHRTTDQVGVIIKAWVDSDHIARAEIKFSQSARGQEILRDVLDGIRRNISFGYLIDNETLQKGEAGSPDTYIINHCTALEISIVAIPADASVGVGRSIEIIDPLPSKPEVKKMSDELNQQDTAEAEKARKTAIEQARKEELSRQREITALARKFFKGKDADEFIDEHVQKGTSADETRQRVLERLENKPHIVQESIPAVEVGLTNKEVKRFDLFKLLRALDEKDPNAAAFEFECSRAVEKASGKTARGAFLPAEVTELLYGSDRRGNRGMDILTSQAGGATVQTSLLSQDFISMLRASSVTAQVGARYLTGLRDNLAIPRQTTLANATWSSDTQDVDETDVKFDQVDLPRKVLGTFVDVSRGLLRQSSFDIQALILSELMSAMALGLDNGALKGDGTGNNPTGLFATVGIPTETFAVAPSWVDIVGMETSLVGKNAYMGNLAYVTTADMMKILKTTLKANVSGASGFIWDGSSSPEGQMPVWGLMNQHRALASTQIPADKILFGNFGELMFGFWSGIDVLVDPFALGKSGGLRVRVMQDVGVIVRRKESFSILKVA